MNLRIGRTSNNSRCWLPGWDKSFVWSRDMLVASSWFGSWSCCGWRHCSAAYSWERDCRYSEIWKTNT